MNYYLCFDVGGTEIKCGYINTLEEVSEIYHFPAKANGSKDEILNNFIEIIEILINKINGDKTIIGLGLGFPGPFDYENGISLIKGLNKYENIYGVNIKYELIKKITTSSLEKYFINNCPIKFIHDVKSFALGIANSQEYSSYKNIFCLALGTGVGSAFISEKQISHVNVPKDGYVHNVPYKNGLIEDYVSTNNLKKISKNIVGYECDGKMLFDLCNEGNEQALEVYKIFGTHIRDSLKDIILNFNTDLVVVTGQVVKSFKYFNEVELFCNDNNIGFRIEGNGSFMCLKGLVA
ncbi:MAG: ROK family protein [Lachnospirales bacterium]